MTGSSYVMSLALAQSHCSGHSGGRQAAPTPLLWRSLHSASSHVLTFLSTFHTAFWWRASWRAGFVALGLGAALTQGLAEGALRSDPQSASLLWPWQTHTRMAWYRHTLRTQGDGEVLLGATWEALRWDANEAELWQNMALLLQLGGHPGPAGAAYARVLRLNPILRAQAVAAAAQANPTGGKEQ
jgi:hypothetical protein